MSFVGRQDLGLGKDCLQIGNTAVGGGYVLESQKATYFISLFEFDEKARRRRVIFVTNHNCLG